MTGQSQHNAIRTLIRDTALSLRDDILFMYARASDANSKDGKKYPFIRLDPLRQSVEFTESAYNMTKTYNVGLVFYGLDKPETAEEETAIILDECDLLSDKFINKLNLFVMGEDSTQDITHEELEIKNVRKTPFIKVFSDVLSGFIVEFDLVVPDTFEYCEIYD